MESSAAMAPAVKGEKDNSAMLPKKAIKRGEPLPVATPAAAKDGQNVSNTLEFKQRWQDTADEGNLDGQDETVVISLVGMPGAGKETQGELLQKRLAKTLDIHISKTCDIFEGL